ncbi:hypothetical protein FOZ62_017267, partial [Perkinsus olseni]
EDGDDSEAEGSILNEDESIHEGPIPIEKSELRLFLKLTEEQFREQLGPLQRESADILYKVPVKELFAYLDGETRGGSFIFSHYEDCEKLCSLHRRCGLDEQQRLVILVNHRDSLAKVYVPSGKARSYLFFKNHHHPLFAAHIGGQRCYENIKQKYFWPNMARDIRRLVQGCSSCQKSKCTTLAPSARIRSVRLEPPQRFQRLQMDFFAYRE